MVTHEDASQEPFLGLPLLAAADIQDHLLMVSNDLDRLHALLTHACDELMQCFHGATRGLGVLDDAAGRSPALDAAMRQLGNAVVALQFEDMATQLIQHTHRRVRSCVDQLARQTFADDEDGPAEVELPPLHPNPVTQDEMDAGSVELF
jgi:hypothetical protein